MKRRFLRLAAATLASAAAAASAQIEVTWSLVHDRTVLMEPVLARVRIANYSGQDLDLTARGNAKLDFQVEDQPTSTVATYGALLANRPVIVPAGDVRDVEVNLLDAYRLLKGQTYSLAPVLEFAGMRFLGARLALEVQPGLELFKRDYGMPADEDARAASLRLLHRERSDHLFFRLDKPATGYCLGVYDLGRVIRFFAPRLERDGAGAFHVLHQNGPDRFVHSEFDGNGVPRDRKYYAAESGGIRLERLDTGAVQVAGGTPFEVDPDHPGMLTAPVLPPANPYDMNIGELPAKGKLPPAK